MLLPLRTACVQLKASSWKSKIHPNDLRDTGMQDRYSVHVGVTGLHGGTRTLGRRTRGCGGRWQATPVPWLGTVESAVVFIDCRPVVSVFQKKKRSFSDCLSLQVCQDRFPPTHKLYL